MKTPIVFSSSTQVNKNNSYGKSKKECEKILLNLKKNNNNKIFILRLPNIYGKWSKPNYNSVVSTFCYNISRKKKIKISDPKKFINLIYIDDCIDIFIDIKNNFKEKFKIYKNFKNIKKINLKELAKIIFQFELMNQFLI